MATGTCEFWRTPVPEPAALALLLLGLTTLASARPARLHSPWRS